MSENNVIPLSAVIYSRFLREFVGKKAEKFDHEGDCQVAIMATNWGEANNRTEEQVKQVLRTVYVDPTDDPKIQAASLKVFAYAIQRIAEAAFDLADEYDPPKAKPVTDRKPLDAEEFLRVFKDIEEEA